MDISFFPPKRSIHNITIMRKITTTLYKHFFSFLPDKMNVEKFEQRKEISQTKNTRFCY